MGNVKEIITLIEEEYKIDHELACVLANYVISDSFQLSNEAYDFLEDYYGMNMAILEHRSLIDGKLMETAKLL